MKKLGLLLIGSIFIFSSCALHNGLTYNTNNHTTEVVLTKKNFRIVQSVQGDSKATYVFGIGGLSKNALIAEAKTEMLLKANLIGSSKAIINETVEVKSSFFPIFRVYKVFVSAHVIEFTE